MSAPLTYVIRYKSGPAYSVVWDTARADWKVLGADGAEVVPEVWRPRAQDDPELLALKRDLRRAQLMLDALPTYGGKRFSAIYRHQVAMRARYAAPVRTLKRKIAARRKVLGLGPVPKFPKRGPVPSWVNRIRQQYRDVEATEAMWAAWVGNVTPAPDYAQAA
jgi:hypothetical protein